MKRFSFLVFSTAILLSKSEAFSPRADDFNVDYMTSQNTIDDSSDDLQPSTKVTILKTILQKNVYFSGPKIYSGYFWNKPSDIKCRKYISLYN